MVIILITTMTKVVRSALASGQNVNQRSPSGVSGYSLSTFIIIIIIIITIIIITMIMIMNMIYQV